MTGYAGMQGMTRRVRDWVVAGVGVGAVVLLTGCAAGSADAEPSASTDASSSPSVDTSAPAPTSPAAPSTAAVPEGIDTSDWLDFATGDGTVTFRYPADWTIASESVDFQPDAGRDDVEDPYQRIMDSATLTAPNGQVLLQMEDFVDIGGACDPESLQPVEVLATEPAPVFPLAESEQPVIATVALGAADGGWTMGIGITGPERLDGRDTCSLSFVSGASDGGVSIGTDFALTSAGDDPLWTVATLDDARAYMETEEYATIVEILRSVVAS